MNPNYILWAIPFFLLSVVGEWLHNYLKHRNDFNFADSITNLNTGIGSQAANALFKAMLLMLFGWMKNHFAVMEIGFSWWSFVVCTILFDYLFYWAHRWGHEMNIFWGAHIVHHQSEEYNLTVALRQSWFHNLLAFPIFLPIPLLGFDMTTFGAAAGLVTLYQYWIHTKLIDRLPAWFEYVFNTPSHHRVHHATNPQYLDRNYGAMFILWDRFHGTFAREEEQPVYGITVPLRSWNPVWANLHFYIEMWEGSRRLRTISDKLALIFRGPEYLGQLLGIGSKDPDAFRHVPKYATATPLHLRIYVCIQFLVLTYFLAAYMGQFAELTMFYKFAFFFLVIISTLSMGALLENRTWFYITEIARFLMFVPVYGLCYYTYFPEWYPAALPFSIGISVVSTAWMLIDLLAIRPQRQAQQVP